MTRLLITTALTLSLPFVVQAQDVPLRAPITAATVFMQGAEVFRSVDVALTDGAQRILIALPDSFDADLLQITGPDGVTVGLPQRIGVVAIADGALDTPDQAAARATVTAAEDALQAAQDAIAGTDAQIQAIDLQVAYLGALARGGEGGAAMPADPASVSATLTTLGAEMRRTATELQVARIARRDLAEAVTDAQTVLTAALAGLNRLQPINGSVDVVAVDVTTTAAGTVPLDLRYFTQGAGWQPSYELRLDSDSGDLDIARFINFYADGRADWQDVAVTFSTATPARARVPACTAPQPARIRDPRAQAESRAGFGQSALNATPMMADAIVAAPAPVVMADMQVTGLAVSYVYAAPVTVGPGGEVTLPFDNLGLSMDLENRAVPRWDATAFLVAMGDNDTGEPILPGQAYYFRDGALVGEGFLPLIADGAEMEVGFGPLDHLQLIWEDRALNQGDRGLIVTSNTQVQEVAFGVRNTSNTAEEVRIIYATPFAEQEDLDLDLTLQPAPTIRDIDNMRGVHEWVVEVAPGTTDLIEMTAEFSWPEGMVLDWRP